MSHPMPAAALRIWSKDILRASWSHLAGSCPFAFKALATASGKVMHPARSSQSLSVPFLMASYKGSTLPPMWPHFLVPGFWSSVLNEHLGQLHGGSDASMSGVCVCDDGIQVVLGALVRLHTTSLLVLLAIMEQLGTEELPC
eukprot:Skav236089  [mRNA]  locus=scaffold1166:84223:86595:- [translate_table: standard]